MQRQLDSDAAVTTEDGGPVAQDGLVNVNVTDVVVQAPISVVANVCDVTVAVLVSHWPTVPHRATPPAPPTRSPRPSRAPQQRRSINKGWSTST